MYVGYGRYLIVQYLTTFFRDNKAADFNYSAPSVDVEACRSVLMMKNDYAS